jgi:hypothetical protein
MPRGFGKYLSLTPVDRSDLMKERKYEQADLGFSHRAKCRIKISFEESLAARS